MKTKKQPEKQNEIELAQGVSEELIRLHNQRVKIQGEIDRVVNIVLAQANAKVADGTKVRITQDFKKLIY